VKKLDDLGLDAGEVGAGSAKIQIVSLEMPPERAPGRMINGNLDAAGKAKELVRLLHEEARVI
jgi:electron transfer flavoprotein beta subunit